MIKWDVNITQPCLVNHDLDLSFLFSFLNSFSAFWITLSSYLTFKTVIKKTSCNLMYLHQKRFNWKTSHFVHFLLSTQNSGFPIRGGFQKPGFSGFEIQLNLDLRDSSVTDNLSLKPSFLLNRVFFLLENRFWSQKVVS